MSRSSFVLLVSLPVLLWIVPACGGGSTSSPTAPTAVTSPSATTPPAASPPATTAPPANANISGNYTWAVRNSPSCPAFSRDWSITITQNGTTVAVTTPTLFQALPFTGVVSGNSVSFPSVPGGSFSVMEGFGSGFPTATVVGQMTGTVAGTTISGAIIGGFGPGVTGCNAANHTFTMTRR